MAVLSMAAVKLTVTIQRKHPRLPRFFMIPSKAIAAWALEGTAVIEGTLNGADLGRRTIKRWDDNRWFIDLTESICRKARVETGERVELVMRPASKRLPKELKHLLARDPCAQAKWDNLTVSQQRLLREHVLSAKQAATRLRRAKHALQC
jgi:hypothetical protein